MLRCQKPNLLMHPNIFIMLFIIPMCSFINACCKWNKVNCNVVCQSKRGGAKFIGNNDKIFVSFHPENVRKVENMYKNCRCPWSQSHINEQSYSLSCQPTFTSSHILMCSNFNLGRKFMRFYLNCNCIWDSESFQYFKTICIFLFIFFFFVLSLFGLHFFTYSLFARLFMMLIKCNFHECLFKGETKNERKQTK